MRERKLPAPDNAEGHFNGFTNWAETLDKRHEFAQQLIDPALIRIPDSPNASPARPNLPNSHSGYDFLLGNYGSSEFLLKQYYFLLKDLMAAAEHTKLGQRVILTAFVRPDKRSRVHRDYENEPVNMLDGPTELITGVLASDSLAYTARGKMGEGARKSSELPPPYVITTAGLQLAEVEKVTYDIATREVSLPQQSTDDKGIAKINTFTLGASLDITKYEDTRFAAIRPIVIGDEACDEFFARLDEEYAVLSEEVA